MRSNLRSRAQGFTLVEIMVSMAMSLILLSGVLSVLYSSKLTYNENERVARLQENMRAGVEIMLRDIRGAGYPGCARALRVDDFTSELANPTGLLWNFARPIEGFDAQGTGWSPALTAPLSTANVTSGNDVIVVRTIRSNAHTYPLSKSMKDKTDVVTVKNADDTLRADVPMIVSNCQKATAFAATAVVLSNPTSPATDRIATLSHVAGGTGTGSKPGNTSDEIGTFSAGGLLRGTVAPVDTIIYYIAPSASGRGPALWRISGTEPVSDPTAPQEVIEGVERLQVLYGVDNNKDLIVDNYVAANAVTDWTSVTAVSLAVIVRSVEEINPEKIAARTFSLPGGGTYTSPSDRRNRAMFTATVTLRNRTT